MLKFQFLLNTYSIYTIQIQPKFLGVKYEISNYKYWYYQACRPCRTTLTAAIANTKLGKFTYKFCTQWIEYINEPIPVSLVKQGRTLKEHNNIMALNKKI